MNRLENLPIPLLEWYRENARTLPWRSDPTPYHVWVSEIMLQQTRVAAVLGYYERFMNRLPTVFDLAEADEQTLMKLWQGLGYYNRARNLQKAAALVVQEHGGVFPRTYDEVLRLPGIGEYTAGAICSIAFGLAAAAVDGNVLRVAARIAGDEGDITTPAMKKKVTAAIRAVMPTDAPGDFNQALMELGATVCLPSGAPLCDRCPAAAFCVARLEERTATLPVKTPKKARRLEERTVFLIVRGKQVALRQRPPRGLLAGLWEFPNELGQAEGALDEWGLTPTEITFGAAGRHIFTHIEWHMKALCARVGAETLPPGWVWASWDELVHTYAVPGAFDAFVPLVRSYLV